MDVLKKQTTTYLKSFQNKFLTYYWDSFSYVGKLWHTVWDVCLDGVGLAGLPESHTLPSEW